ncbi:MAG: circadian clock KaiB family protein [Bacteroidota bacterium]
MKKTAKSAGTLQSPPAHRSHQKYVLRLYVTGTTTRSMHAIANIKNICENYLKGRYQLEVIDIYENPSLGKGEQIIASPTLIKKLPLPLRRFIGDLSNTERILLGLDLQPGHYSDNKTKNVPRA